MLAQFPEKFKSFFDPWRYKVAWGGRGSAKSWSVARILLIKAANKQLRILCARELQNSLDESVHKLLANQIEQMNLQAYFVVQRDRIFSPITGSEFIFEGVRHNTNKIKSMEGIDICWIEEAERITKSSLDTLIPTIRKDGSEIWLTFNPFSEDDEVWKRFVVAPPANALVVNINYQDNPWFTQTLRNEMEECKARDYQDYLFIWEGKFKKYADGAVWREQLSACEEQGRVRDVPYEPTLGVYTAWDLGVRDSTSIWFWQEAGNEIRVIDYYEASGEGLPHYAHVLQEKGYIYKDHYAPHDIRVRELGSGLSRYEVAQNLGIYFNIVPQVGLEDGIHSARMLIPRCYFDKTKCHAGLNGLRNYRRTYDESLGTFRRGVVHDWASHPSDAFRYLAVSVTPIANSSPKSLKRIIPSLI